MNKNIKFSENQIKIRSSKRMLGLLSVGGALFILAGFLPLHAGVIISHLLIGFGIIFFCGGLLLFIGSKYFKIVIDNDKGFISILESSYRLIDAVRIPVDYYTSIVIQRTLANSKGKEIDDTNFGLYLMNDFGSTLYIAEFSSLKETIAIGKKIQDTLAIDLINEEDSLNTLRKNRKKNNQRVNFMKSEKSPIKEIIDGNSRVLFWKNRKNILQNIFILGTIFGFLYLIYFIVFIGGMDILSKGLFFLVGGIIFFIAILAIVFDLIGTNYLFLSPDKLHYQHGVFGKKFKGYELKKSELGLLRNSINETDSSIQVLSQHGVELIKKIMLQIRDTTGSGFNLGLITDFLSLKNEVFEINVGSLSLSDRLFVESQILEILR